MMNLPEAFIQQMRELLGPEAEEFFSEYAGECRRSLRINPLHAAAKAAAEEYALAPVPWCPMGRYYDPEKRPGASVAHFAGAFYLQESAAMAPVMALNPKPGERVLDLCAAPGGKSTEILSLLNGEGALLANEIDGKRSRILASNIERMGFFNAAVTNESPDRLAKVLPGAFDAVLVDAPCSGEGMFRREPESIGEWSAASPAGCAARQAQILDSAAELVRPGGRMCYSTCTFNRQENEESIENFLARHPEFSLMSFNLPGLSSETGMHRLWPHRGGGEGHFMALMRKVGEERPDFRRRKTETQGALTLFLEKELKIKIFFDVQEIRGDLFSAPDLPPLKGLRVVSQGAQLTETVGKTVRPAHALSRLPLEFGNVTPISHADALRYIAGEEISAPGAPGWTLVTTDGLPLGFGKRSGDTVKNHLPKGLRMKLHE